MGIQKNNYDLTASFYDRLAGIIFGGAIHRSQTILLHQPFPGTRVIIVGGGTGAILEDLARIKSASLSITFIELSEKMLRKARKRNAGSHRVEFICGDAGFFTNEHPYDVIITPFLFDNFTATKAEEVFNHLNRMLSSNGIWLFTDFNVSSKSPWWQKCLLRLMYFFFGILAKVEARQLPDTDQLFLDADYFPDSKHYFYRGFIRSVAYRKTKL